MVCAYEKKNEMRLRKKRYTTSPYGNSLNKRVGRLLARKIYRYMSYRSISTISQSQRKRRKHQQPRHDGKIFILVLRVSRALLLASNVPERNAYTTFTRCTVIIM